MKNYTSQSAGQSYSWLCIMLTSHNHCYCDRGRDVKREERKKQGSKRKEVQREEYDRKRDGVKWSGEEIMKLQVGKEGNGRRECKGAMTERRNGGNEIRSGQNRCWSVFIFSVFQHYPSNECTVHQYTTPTLQQLPGRGTLYSLYQLYSYEIIRMTDRTNIT